MPLTVDQDEVATGGGSTSITLTSANTVTKDNVTLAFSNCQWLGSYYGTNYGIGLSSAGYYQNGGSVTVSVPEGYKLDSISFNFVYGAGDMSASVGDYNYNGNNAIWTSPANGTRTVTLTNTSTRMTRYVLTFNVAYSSASGSGHAFE